jgi:peptidyl-prolyl cis-trans isomerase A (cyclophilin A)
MTAIVACGEKAPAKTDAAPPPASASNTSPVSPDSFRVSFVTSKGTFVVAVTRSLSPHGADRFYQLVQADYFTDVRFFRVVSGHIAQFGMHGDPVTNAKAEAVTIRDEPVAASNVRGTISFATSGPDSRSNQLFINLIDNPMLDGMGFSPIGRVVDGMKVVDGLYGGYGEKAGRAQDSIAAGGNAFLSRVFPKLDYIRSATVLDAGGAVR